MDKYVIGLDFGTDQGRALVVNALTGETLATCAMKYPRWSQGKFCVPNENLWRHHPLDYLEVMEHIIKESLAQCADSVRANVVGIALDTTGSTPALTDETGTPLAMLPEFASNPNAMFILWKDHTAVAEAREITELCKSGTFPDYTKYVGGVYSAEWFWAKVMHVMREDDYVASIAHSVVEVCEWLPAVLTGVDQSDNIVRSRCAYGHKAMWHKEWGGLPPEEFLVTLDSKISGYRLILPKTCYTADKPVGTLCREWAERLGLSTDVVVAGGAYDCHMGAVGAGITPNTLVRVIGPSTCDVIVVPQEEKEKCIRGICGQVDGSVIPGMTGLEAGQSSFGDVFSMFSSVLEYSIRDVLPNVLLSKLGEDDIKEVVSQTCSNILARLVSDAQQVTTDESTMLATDWINGRRSPDANQTLKGTITGFRLNTTAPHIFRALVEATAYGTKAIIDRFEEEGIHIDNVTAIGDLALRSDFIMQTMCDVINKPIKICNTDHACALGAAMFAATAAGVHDSIEKAIEAMNSGFLKEYFPVPTNAETYRRRYDSYTRLGRFTEHEKLI